MKTELLFLKYLLYSFLLDSNKKKRNEHHILHGTKNFSVNAQAIYFIPQFGQLKGFDLLIFSEC